MLGVRAGWSGSGVLLGHRRKSRSARDGSKPSLTDDNWMTSASALPATLTLDCDVNDDVALMLA